MDEYIKREDALDAVLFALVGTGLQSCAIYAIRDVPTADVVPKSEVERLQAENERLTINMNAYGLTAKRLAEERAEFAMEIFAEIERKSCVISETNHSTGSTRVVCHQISAEKLAELKKKYTEGVNEC